MVIFRHQNILSDLVYRTLKSSQILKIFSLSLIKLSKNKSVKNNNDDAQKTSRPNAPDFDGMVVVRKALKEENNRSKVIEVNQPKTL